LRNLPLPARPKDSDELEIGVQQYRYAGNLRGHQITDAEVNQIVQLYNDYDHQSGMTSEPLKGAAFPASLVNEIYSAYGKTYGQKALSDIRNDLLKSVDLCPTCGINAAKELDHHLPRSVFKPLAIYRRNLVPMCHDCNSLKSNDYGAGADAHLHAYFDTLPDVEYLDASIEIRNDALVIAFSIDIAAVVPVEMRERLVAHLRRFQLPSRWNDEANSYLSSLSVALNVAYNATGQDGVKSFLRKQATFERVKFYENHWRPVLLSVLADHDEFTDGGVVAALPVPDDILNDLIG